MPTAGSLAAAFALLSVLFWPLERWWPSRPDQRRWRRPGVRTDLLYWFFTPLVTRAVTRLAVVAAVVALALVAGVPLDRGALQAFAGGRGRWTAVPVGLQALVVVVVGTGRTGSSTGAACGASTPSTTPPPRWTGCPRYGCTPSTTW
jgi:hypothetical protein